MKKLIALLALCFLGSGLSASHMAGGEMWYEFTGDSLNPYDYRIWLQFYRDVGGIAAPMNEEISVKSSCYPDICVNLTFSPFVLQNPGTDTSYGSVTGSILTPDLEECVDVTSGGTFVQTEIYRFYADVTLNGPCHDWTFGFNENARNPNDNLGANGTGTFYIETKLNNTLGPNSSPVFVNPAAKSFCVGSPFVWSQAAVEPDGDSLYFDFGTPLYSADACPTTPSAVGWAPGYSQRSPMQTASGISIDHANGTFNFTPSNTEVDVINVTVTEKRYDTATGTWLINGTSVRDLQVPILQACKSSTAGGPKLDYNQSGFTQQPVNRDSILNYLDSLGLSNVRIDSTPSGTGYDYTMGVVEYDCYDTAVTLSFNTDVLCESITPDGDEFRITSATDSSARPIVAANFTCNPDLTFGSVDLALHKPLDVNGDYFLQIRKGWDGNTLTNRCGFELNEFYTMIIQVENCPELIYNLENVTVEEDEQIRIDWHVDPQSFRPESEELFSEWSIWRAPGDNKFNKIDALDNKSDVNTRSFTDDSMEPSDLDNVPFQYRIQLVQNFIYRKPTNSIDAIRLSDTLNNDSTAWDLYWTEYNGWASPTYELFIGQKDTVNNTMDWKNYEGPDSNLYVSNFAIPEPVTDDTAGLYAFKVEATDPFDPDNSHISESNWIWLELGQKNPNEPEDPEEVVTPNVFTPNGDGKNDVFYVSARYYTDASIEIYNRWGKLVFRTSDSKAREAAETLHWDGRDQNSGEILADGVYYYVLSLRDEVTGESKNLNGSLNVFKD